MRNTRWMGKKSDWILEVLWSYHLGVSCLLTQCPLSLSLLRNLGKLSLHCEELRKARTMWAEDGDRLGEFVTDCLDRNISQALTFIFLFFFVLKLVETRYKISFRMAEFEWWRQARYAERDTRYLLQVPSEGEWEFSHRCPPKVNTFTFGLATIDCRHWNRLTVLVYITRLIK